MKIKTTTTHSIELDRDDLKERLFGAFLDMLKDELDDNIDYAEANLSRLTDYMEQINKGNFGGVFEDGYSMMILPPDVFEFVCEWFENGKEKLELVIMDKNGNKEIVTSDQISY